MLTEDDVVEAVCRHLETGGYRIVSRCTTSDRGEDIVAEHPSSGVTLRGEAKGETSNKPATARVGKPFDGGQVQHHVAKAFYTAAAMLDGEGGRACVAFPDTPLHREYLGRIRAAIHRLDISVLFWVRADRTVTIESTD